MKVEMIGKYELVSFDSLNEFYKYICNTPLNVEAFQGKQDSITGSYRFCQTYNFDEAVELFKNGWDDMAKKLTQRLKAIEKETKPIMKPRNQLSVCGYHPVVPLYLQGVPNNMIDKKNIPVKQKVITITKSIAYHAGISTSTIVEESLKALQIVKKIETQGYRVNLNIMFGTSADKKIALKIRIKNAGEKLNISKLAFPLVHPSMLRRLIFRFIETYPSFTRRFRFGYGKPMTTSELQKLISKNEYLIPHIIIKSMDKIKGIEDLEKL